MSHKFADRVADTTSTTGTGAFALDGSSFNAYRNFGDVCDDGDTIYYSAAHRTLNQWEVGKGTYGAGTNVLTRTLVLASSNADAAVNFSSGTKDLVAGVPASVIDSASSGVVVTPSTDNGVPRFDGVLGGMQNSGVTIDDSDNIATHGAVQINVSGHADKVAGARGPLFIWSDPSATAAGQNAGMQIWVGANPVGTPGANDFVAQTIAMIGGNGKASMWGQNISVGTDSAGLGANAFLIGSEINMYSNYALVETDPWGAGADRKGIFDLTTTGPYRVTSALMTYSTATDGSNWPVVGLAVARIVDTGLLFKASPGGSTDTLAAFAVAAIHDASNSASVLKVSGTHTSVLNLSAIAAASMPTGVLLPSDGSASFAVRNNADFATFLAVDSGSTSSFTAGVAFKDRTTNKWIIQKGAANTLQFLNSTTAAVAAAIDASSNVIVGNATAVTGAGAATAIFQAHIPISGVAGQQTFIWNNDALAPSMQSLKSRSGVIGSHTIVQANDNLLNLTGAGSDGTNFLGAGAIRVYVDGTPGTNDMPGRLAFYTTADGASTSTERMRIDNAGNVIVNTAAIATNATDGFLYIPTCAGTPTGAPTSYTGRIPLVYDSSNNFLYVYNSGWKKSTVYA